MMPLSPARRRTQVRRSFREPRPSPFLCAVRTRFGRKKEPLKPSGFTMPSWRMIAATTRRGGVAGRAGHGAGGEARGDLEGERLARARRHDADAVASREHGRDDLLLPRAKLGVAEDAGQDVAGSEAGRERELIDAGRIAEMPR